MLAVNALVLTILVLVIVGAVVFWFCILPTVRVVDKACDKIDHLKEAKEKQERLDREQEVLFRSQAEKELNDQINNLHAGQE